LDTPHTGLSMKYHVDTSYWHIYAPTKIKYRILQTAITLK
jgi:hypothetical protein